MKHPLAKRRAHAPGRSPARLIAAALAFALAFGPSVGTAASGSATASRFYEDALQRFDKRDLPGAVIQLKNALQADKNLLPAHVLLGRVLLAQSDVSGAEAALAEALRLGVSRAEVAVPLARAIMLQGRPKEVLSDSRFALAGLPASVQIQLLVMQAQAASDLDDTKIALRATEDARAIDPTAIETWLAEVPIRIRSRQFAEAMAAVNKALSLKPDLAEAHYQRASVLHVQGERQGALEAYAKALALDPQHAESRIARAGLLVDSGLNAEAAPAVDDLLARMPNEPRAIYLKAVLASRAGDRAAAHAALRKVTGVLDPLPIEMMRYRSQLLLVNALAHHDLGEPEKAKPLLEIFQRGQPGSPAAKLLAQMYMAEQKADAAADVLETYLRLQPGDAQALALLASAQLARGRHAKAASLMQDALRTRDAPEFHAVLGISQLKAGQTAGALSSLETAHRKDPRQLQAGFALALLHLQAREPAKALAVANTLEKAHPRHAGLANLTGLARSLAKDSAGARTAFERALQLDPGFVDAKLNLARLDIAARAYDRADARLVALFKEDETNAEVMYERAHLSELRGRTEDALNWLQKAAARDGDMGLRAGLALIDFHIRKGRFDDAQSAARQLASARPNNVAVLLAVARSELAVRDAAAARATLAQAARLANFGPVAQVEIASLQVMAGNLPGASYSLDKALAADPSHLAARVMQAEVLARQGDYTQSDQRLREILKAHPRSAMAHSVQGSSYLARGNASQAIESFRRAYQSQPSAQTLLQLFDAMAPHDKAGAVAVARQWIQSRPRDQRVRSALAEFYVRSADYRAARGLYEEVLRLAPNDTAALNNLANVQLRLSDGTALATAERALALQPSSAIVLDTAGWAAHHAGQHERALQLLRDARLRDPGRPVIRFHLASVLAKAGRHAEARDELHAALKDGRRFDGDDEAQALLRSLK